MRTPLPRLLIEAVVVATAFVAISSLVHAACMWCAPTKAMSHPSLAAQAAVAAFLFHIACEYSGVNEWYCNARES